MAKIPSIKKSGPFGSTCGSQVSKLDAFSKIMNMQAHLKYEDYEEILIDLNVYGFNQLLHAAFNIGINGFIATGESKPDFVVGWKDGCMTEEDMLEFIKLYRLPCRKEFIGV